MPSTGIFTFKGHTLAVEYELDDDTLILTWTIRLTPEQKRDYWIDDDDDEAQDDTVEWERDTLEEEQDDIFILYNDNQDVIYTNQE